MEACSVVAGLFVSITFSVATSMPDDVKGKKHVKASKIFSASSFVAFYTSLIAVVMFLSILTSERKERDFRHALPRKLLLGLIVLRKYFYVIGISFNKMYFICIWINLSMFKMIITSGYIENVNIIQELFKKSVICKSRYLLDKSSICRDSLKLNTCLDLSSLRDSNYSQQCFYSKKLFVYEFV